MHWHPAGYTFQLGGASMLGDLALDYKSALHRLSMKHAPQSHCQNYMCLAGSADVTCSKEITQKEKVVNTSLPRELNNQHTP